MKARLNDKIFEVEPYRITDVATLKARMANGALLYWTCINPKHAVLFDPEKQTIVQLGIFNELWSLQRSKQIRHDHFEGIYQVFVPTPPSLQKARAAHVEAEKADTLFAQCDPALSNPDSGTAVTSLDSIVFEPRL